jgi:hypothetical protein
MAFARVEALKGWKVEKSKLPFCQGYGMPGSGAIATF